MRLQPGAIYRQCRRPIDKACRRGVPGDPSLTYPSFRSADRCRCPPTAASPAISRLIRPCRRPDKPGAQGSRWDGVAIAALFSVRPETINKRIHDIRQVLGQAGHAIEPGPRRLASLDDLHRLAAAEGIVISSEIKTAC
jgi:hypothetical protein